MRSLTTIFVSVFVSLTLLFAATHFFPIANYNQVRDSTVRVSNSLGMCSGVVISKVHVLTAAHCDGPNLKVDGRPAFVLKKNEKADLLLLITITDKPALPIAATRPSLDEKVAMSGYPLDVGEVVTEGRMHRFTQPSVPEFMSEHYMLVTSPGVFGNSGGPVVVRKGLSYEVVGIVSRVGIAALDMGMFSMPNIIPHISFVVNTETINKFLEY